MPEFRDVASSPQGGEFTPLERTCHPLKVLIVDDEESIRVTLEDALAGVGHRVVAAADGQQGLVRLQSDAFDVVITDVRMPGATGLDVLRAAREKHGATEVILMTAYGTVDTAVDAMRQGAFHYVLKPFLNEELVLLVERIARMRDLEDKNRALSEDLGRLDGFENVIGSSPPMNDVVKTVRTVASTDASILIEGESGTGKEVIARAIHRNSTRRDGPFVALSCAALPDSLIEAELFGHERGAFTGADRTTPGKFEVADGGTLFIDEIGELPGHLQGKLLRVLQDREFERVGGTSTVKTDIRVICATHRDLAAMVDAGRFREDLYYRIRVVPIELPALRARGREDLLRLVEHFVDKYGRRHERSIQRVTPAAIERLVAHDWPGNIRELENCIESAVVLCDDGVIDGDALPLGRRRGGAARASELGDPELSLATIERLHIERVLAACGGNQSEAARKLGIGRNTLARKLEGE